MKTSIFTTLFCFAFISIMANGNSDQPWFDTSLPEDIRAEALVEAMTLEEKIGQLMDQAPAIPRLGVPEYNWWNECLHGVARNGRSTVFPQAIGLGATFDEDLIFRVATAISDEARAKFNVAIKNDNRSRYAGLTFWSPNVNIFRDPRWGRGQETYGEDPYLTSRIGVNFVKGLQGDHPKYLKAAACAKHYVVHSGPEALRHEFDAVVGQKDLWETYMPAFKALVTEGKVAGVMGAYNRTNGEACCASPYLLKEVLWEQWGFDGYVVSDCGAIQDIWKYHKLTPDPAEASAMAIKSGLQLNCGQTFKALKDAVDKSLITVEEIDQALIQLSKIKFRLGMFDPIDDNPYNEISQDVVGCEEHKQLALEAARKSLVMVKNKNNVLPLDKNIRRLYVTGPQASTSEVLLGNYYGITDRTINILDGIASKVSLGTTINYKYGQLPYRKNVNPIDWTTGEAKSSDACIAVIGINGLWEGEEGESLASANKGDHVDSKLPQAQVDFIKKLKANNDKPLIVVITGGAPLIIPEIYELADAIIYAWYPGEQGGLAVADVIFGDVSPSGRLPFTIPTDISVLPDFSDYNMVGRTYRYMNENILFPFGFGLSYGDFTYENVSVVRKNKMDFVEVAFTIKNKGNVKSDEVAQVYIKQPGENVPFRKLVGFKRISVEPGMSKNVKLEIPIENFEQFSEKGEQLLKKGTYEIMVGGVCPVQRSKELDANEWITQSISLK